MKVSINIVYQQALYVQITLASDLNMKPRYKRERPSHFRQHLISILIKSCRAQGCSELFTKDYKIKS